MKPLRGKYREPAIRRLARIRAELASKYGNLYGLRLGQWFWFNGETALLRGGRENLAHFELRLHAHRNSKGSQAQHRACRQAEKAAA